MPKEGKNNQADKAYVWDKVHLTKRRLVSRICLSISSKITVKQNKFDGMQLAYAFLVCIFIVVVSRYFLLGRGDWLFLVNNKFYLTPYLRK